MFSEKNKVTKEFINSQFSNFYEDYTYIHPLRVLFLIIVTFGFYIIHWIYTKNKEFEVISGEAPNSIRGIFVILVFPLFWVIFFLMYNFLFKEGLLFVSIFEKIVWCAIIFLILQYLYEFCVCFSKVSLSNSLFWYSVFFPGFLGLSLFAFNIYYGVFLLFFVVIVIPIMQANINKIFQDYNFKVKGERFNSMTRKNNVY